VVVKKLSACITFECGSFIAAICRQRRQLISSHSSNNTLRPQQHRSLALHPPSTLVAPGACSATASERNQLGFGWPARLRHHPFPFLHPFSHFCPLPHSSERGSASTRAVRTHTVYSRPAKFTPPDTSTFSMTYRLATLPPPLDLDAVITATSYRSTLARRPARLFHYTFRQHTQAEVLDRGLSCTRHPKTIRA
jgi:hypothetical protein